MVTSIRTGKAGLIHRLGDWAVGSGFLTCHYTLPSPASVLGRGCMSDSVNRTNNVSAGLQGIRDDLHRRESEAASRADQADRRERIIDRLIERFGNLISFVRRLLAPGKHPRSETFFSDLARSLLAFNEALQE